MKSFKSLVLTCLVTGLFLSCGKKDKEFTSNVNLFVDYVSAHTSGIISAHDEIKVRLAKSVDVAKPGEKAADYFKFSPSIKGETYWEDNRTLVFSPLEPLPGGQEYQAEFNIKALFPESGQNQSFTFTFATIKQNFDITVTGIELYDPTNLTRLKLEGIIQTADQADENAVERLLVARQNGEDKSITWVHGLGQNRHRFQVEEVIRGENEGIVTLSWDGSSLKVEKSDQLDYSIPSLSDFKILSVRKVSGTEQYISVVFSDPLTERQDLRGLIELFGAENYRIVTNINELKIYPQDEPQSEVKLLVTRGIESVAGYLLQEDYETTLVFTQIKPELKAGIAKGNILPGTDGLFLPFEAVSLRAVDVKVVRIFEDNVLQYLQVNQLGESNQLRRVGRPVASKTISLEDFGVTDLSQWNRFTLDLNEIMKAEPGAVYQVEIGFRKQHSLFYCDDTGEEVLVIEEEWDEAAEDETNWDNYEEYYYYDYDWSQRDNPCHQSFYTNNRKIRTILLASDFGIVAKRADQGELLVHITNLLNTNPETGVSLEVYDYQQQLIGVGSSDANGKSVIPVDRKPFAIVAKKGEKTGYLKVDDGSALSLSNFNVSGTEVQKGIKGFVYGERGVWRPGDTLHLNFMLEDKNRTLPAGHPVVLEVRNPLGQLVKRIVNTESVGGLYGFKVTTKPEDLTGTWTGTVKVGGVQFNKYLKIETVKPNRLKINLEFNTDRLTVQNRDLTGELSSRWLHGAIASNLRAVIDYRFMPIKTRFDKFPNYEFDDRTRTFYSGSNNLFSGRLNAEGLATIFLDLDLDSEPAGALRAIFNTKVFEEGGDFSINSKSIPYYPYSHFVGIKAPEGDRRGMLVTDQDHTIDIIRVDSEGRISGDQYVEVTLYKLNWRWWWDQSYESLTYISSGYRDPIQTTTASLNDGRGTWTLNIKEPEWGRFLIRVYDPVSGHAASKIVYVDWPGWAGKQRSEMGGASMLSFEMDKQEYSVGEQVSIRIPSSAQGRALISLESGSKVLQSFWAETSEGNTNVQFEATADMAPNVYAHITLLQPHAQTLNDLPIRMYGVESIKVVDDETKLKPIIEMPAELRPEQQVTINIREENSKPMAYTLAVVDEGLLDLTNFKTPDAWNTFYAREALGVKTWDIYDQVIGAFGGELQKLLAVGGGDDESESEDDERTVNRFKPVVEVMGPFFLKAGGKATHKFTMPQYVGSVMTMVVAGYEGAYGSSENTTPVKQPLMILATLPRVAGPGEDIMVPVNVFAMSDNLGSVDLGVATEGNIELQGPARKKVSFNRAGDQVVYFRMKAKEALGPAKVVVNAKAGQHQAKYEVELMIRASNPEIAKVEAELVEGNSDYEATYYPVGLLGTNQGMVELSTLPPLNLEQRLKYLIRFPHGCIEQTTSSVFAQLYIDRLTDISPETQSKIESNIKAAIERIRSFQVTNGGFSYWPGLPEANAWGTNYAGHFLIEARKKGYFVPENLYRNWLNYQQNEANQFTWSANQGSRLDLVQAYRLYVLSLAGKASVGAMNRMKQASGISNTAKWRLAQAYAIAGYDQVADEIVTDLSTSVNNYRELGNTYGSSERDQAMIMETLVTLDKKEEAFEILQQLAAKMSNPDQWLSTQTTAYCLIAVSAYASDFPVDENLDVNLSIAGQDRKITSERFITRVAINDSEKNQPIRLINNMATPVYFRLVRTGIPLVGEDINSTRNINLTVTYKDSQGNPININQLRQGTDFMATAVVHNPGQRGAYEELALTQIFPSGWEIINTRLTDQDQEHGDVPEYQDIRDDRVYTYFDLKPNERKVFTIRLNASYQGKFYLPAVKAGAMYDNEIQSVRAGKWVEVVAR